MHPGGPHSMTCHYEECGDAAIKSHNQELLTEPFPRTSLMLPLKFMPGTAAKYMEPRFMNNIKLRTEVRCHWGPCSYAHICTCICANMPTHLCVCIM